MLFLTWNFLYVQGNHTFYEREKIDLELLGGLIWFLHNQSVLSMHVQRLSRARMCALLRSVRQVRCAASGCAPGPTFWRTTGPSCSRTRRTSSTTRPARTARPTSRGRALQPIRPSSPPASGLCSLPHRWSGVERVRGREVQRSCGVYSPQLHRTPDPTRARFLRRSTPDPRYTSRPPECPDWWSDVLTFDGSSRHVSTARRSSQRPPDHPLPRAQVLRSITNGASWPALVYYFYFVHILKILRFCES